MRHLQNLLWLVPLAVLAHAPMLAFGQAATENAPPAAVIEEVVVSAQKRSEPVQDVPIAVTAFTDEAIAQLGLATVEDVAALVPNLQIKSLFGFTNPTIFLRGVGFNDFNGNAVSAVGLYLDEVYLGPPAIQLFQFYDLERLEVLKGPQGTLYGRNTTGGLINIISRRPTDEYRANAEVRYGRFDEVRVEAGVGGPLIANRLGTRIAGFYQSRDGYVHNRVTGNELNGEEAWGTRLILDAQPSDELAVLFNVSYGESTGDARVFQERGLFPADPAFADPATGLGLCLPQFFNTPSCTDGLGYSDTDGDIFAGDYDMEGEERVDALLASARVDWNLGRATLTSVTGWIDTKRDTAEDTDSSPAQLLDSFFRFDDRQFTQELRLASNDGGALKWMVGAFYLDDEIESHSSFDFQRALRPLVAAGAFPPDLCPANPAGTCIPIFVFTGSYPYLQKTQSSALFSQLDFPLTTTLSATLGLRYTDEDKSIDYRSFADDEAFVFVDARRELKTSDVSGRVSLQWQPVEDLLLYVSGNRGFKSGGFNAAFAQSASDLDPFGEETLDAYEVGTKYDFLNRTARLNTAAFYYDYRDLQVFTFVNRGNDRPDFVIENAADARIYGAEADLTVHPVAGLTTLLSVGFLDTEYVRFQSVAPEGDLSGNRLPATPKWTLSGLLRYETGLTPTTSIYGQIDASYRTRAFFETRNIERLSQDAYALTNLRLGVRSGDRWDLALWVDNVLDKKYALDATDLSAFGFDQVNQAEPRTYGVSVSYAY
ncbi:MAG: TonB-dependent receptor [Steroidobacteraceae bacterium]